MYIDTSFRVDKHNMTSHELLINNEKNMYVVNHNKQFITYNTQCHTHRFLMGLILIMRSI